MKIDLSIHRHYGFTLSEIMIVITVLGVLTAIAYPSYLNYTKNTNRADMMSAMEQMSNKVESNKILFKKYDRIPLDQITPADANLVSGEFDYPVVGDALYSVSIWDTSGSTTQMTGTNLLGNNWEIRAEPIATGSMSGDGKLTLNSEGEKCWQSYCGMNDEWRE